MASANTLIKGLLNVNNTVVNSLKFREDGFGVKHLQIYARPTKHSQCRCPICRRKCPKDGTSAEERVWRSLDFGATMVEVVGNTQRIKCPQHGSKVADVPWAYPGSRFTKEFDLTVAWLAEYLPRKVVSEYMRIDWKTVGRCISRALSVIEPERRARLDGLVNIGIDETSYKKGHKYLTVVVNLDTNTVVWVALGHGKSVLEQFYLQLTPEQLASIKVVTADGARWITECVEEFTPHCERCIDPFHVVQWVNEALDEVRREAWRKTYGLAQFIKKKAGHRQGRIAEDDLEAQTALYARETAKAIKNSTYALGKAPEHLTENQRLQLQMIAQGDPKLYRAYLLKENLRLLLKMDSVEEAANALKHWLWRASHSQIPAMKQLYEKIKRHQQHILNTIRLGFSNAKVEAINNKIKVAIRKAYGFRNLNNLMDMIYLICSNLVIPLPNRGVMDNKAPCYSA